MNTSSLSNTVCQNKKKFSKIEAITILNKCRAKKKNGSKRRKETNIYKCPICSKYHLTSNANWVK